MNWALLLIGAVGLMCIAHGRRTEQLEGVGRLKRRIYKEVSLAQQAGVDFSKPFDALDEHDIEVLETVGTEAEWKQSKRSKESGKSYAEAYYNSLRRAWNAVSGVQGVGKAYNVKDADGNVVLTWIEDAAAHVAQERELQELEKSLAKKRRDAKRERAARQRETQRMFSSNPQNFYGNAKSILADAIDLGERRKPEQTTLDFE